MSWPEALVWTAAILVGVPALVILLVGGAMVLLEWRSR